jgi:hypothetical protein
LVSRAKSKCKKLGLPFDLDKEYLVELNKSQGGKCSKTGIEFQLRPAEGYGDAAPWTPSLDQLDPGKGYTKTNIQLVCFMYNVCKGVWTNNEVSYFAKALLENQ